MSRCGKSCNERPYAVLPHQVYKPSFKPIYYCQFIRKFNPTEMYGNYPTIDMSSLEFVNNRLRTSAKFKVFNQAI